MLKVVFFAEIWYIFEGDFMKKTIIYLIRHSEQLKLKGANNSDESDQIKNEKIILSVDGENKAREMSQKADLLDIDEIYSSNYTRAIATAKYIAYQNSLEINIDSRLGERKLRRFE